MLTTNRIAFLIFIALLAAAALIFKVRDPAHKVIVQVEHVFTATTQKPPAKKPQKTTPKVETHPQQAKTVAEIKTPPKQPRKPATPPEKKETDKPQAKKIAAAPPVKSSPKRSKPQSPQVTSAGKGTITVNKERYMELLREWMRDNGEAGAAPVIPLQVENLENTYALLQMKPVAMVAKRLIDLTDGSVLSLAALSGYSATVFEVRDPWQKLGKELRKAAIRRDQPVMVRYYMYDFIRNGIYLRVNKAYAWCRAHQLLPADIGPDDIDVLGRTFVIAGEDGGRFGVFVPLTVRTRDDHEIKIDPACFSEYADVAALRAGGVL